MKVRYFSILLATLVLVLGFNNCSEEAEFNSPEQLNQSSMAAQNLLDLLEDAKETEARLNAQGTPEATAQANEIRIYIDQIELMISIQGGSLSIDSRPVLDMRDYLLNAHLMGRDMLLEISFNQAIADLQAEDQRLSDRISNLEIAFNQALVDLETKLTEQMDLSVTEINNRITALQNQFDGFKTQVTNKFVQIDNKFISIENVTNILTTRITEVENNITIIENNITTIENSSETAINELRQALNGVKADLQQQIVDIKEEQNEMKKQLAEQQEAFTQYVTNQNQLANIEAKICKLETNGELVAGQTTCESVVGEDGILEDKVLSGQCCMQSKNIDCDIMFPGEEDAVTSVRQQCNAFVVTLQNRDDQMKQLAETDAEQKADIEKIMARVDDLEEVVEGLSAEVQQVIADMQDVKAKVKDLDDRLLIVEFKASRAEAGATLNEMSDLFLAWITRRKADVRNRFCHHNANKAYNRSDYESAKQNWVYCAERLSILNQAQELVQLAKAYTHAVMSLNVDQNCSATVAGKNAEALTLKDLNQSSISRAVMDSCNSGQALTKAYLINIVKLHKKIGPDFRTVEYMAKKAKIAQLLYFGALAHEMSSTEIKNFENVDPTSDSLNETPYGIIERVFKNQYVETRLRTIAGEYPDDPSKFKPNLSGFNTVYSHEQISNGANDYLKRVKALEIEGACGGQCGFKVVGRNQVRKIGQRFSYPKDSQTQCPVHNDIVMVPSQDGKHYAYRVNYTRYRGATENLSPYWRWNANHYPIANSDADVAIGKFRQCGYRVRHLVHRFGIPDTKLKGRLVLRYGTPYAKTHGLPQCRRFHFTCRLWEGQDGQGEWVSSNPNANLLHYLSGYSTAKIQTQCEVSGAAYVAKERSLTSDEKATMRYYKGQQDVGSIAMASSVTSTTTQLTDKYWMLADQAINYGVANKTTSQANPFYGKSTSHGSPFFRKLFKLTDYADIKVQQCYDPVQ